MDFESLRRKRKLSSRHPFDVIRQSRNYKTPCIPSENVPELWNVPSRNINFVGRTDLLNKVEEHFQSGNQPVILTAYHGLGGVGKTHLALEYVWRNYQKYRGVLWFNAESEDRLIEKYVEFGRTCNLLFDKEHLSIQNQANYIKHWLEDPARTGWLIIYDNAPKYGGEKGINSYIPVKGGKVLITSRYSLGWPESFSVDIFTRLESIMLIEKVLSQRLSEREKDLLAETLGDLPLALAQATAYLKKNKINITRYMDLYNTRKERLLLDDTLSESHGTIVADSKKSAVYITWDITMEAIREESFLAEHWLKCCAYLSADEIPIFLIEDFSRNPDNNPNSEIFEEAVGILNSYSMLAVDDEKQCTSIHRLVQEVLQLKEKESPDFQTRWACLRKTEKILRRSWPHADDTDFGYDRKRKLIAHLETILTHLSDCKVNAHDASTELPTVIEKSLITPLLSIIIDGFQATGNTVKQKLYLEKLLSVLEENYGTENFEVGNTLAHLGNAYGQLGDHLKGRDLLQKALSIQEKHYGTDSLEVAVTLTNIALAYGSLGDSSKKLEILEHALKIKENNSCNELEIVATIANLGVANNELGLPKKARDMLERALSIQEKYYGSDHIESVAILLGLGDVYGTLGDVKKNQKVTELALSIQEKYYGTEHVDVGRTLTRLGNIHIHLGYLEKAREILGKSLPIMENYYGVDHIDVAHTLLCFGMAHGPSKTALMLIERSLGIKEKYFGHNHVSVSSNLTTLATIYGHFGDHAKKRDLLERVILIKEEYYGVNHVELTPALTNLGNAYGALGNISKQKELLERSLAMQEEFYGPDHVEVAVTLRSLATVYEHFGISEKAREILERALIIKEQNYGREHIDVGITLIYLAHVYGTLANPAKKCELLKRALEIQKKSYSSQHISVANILANLGITYSTLGDNSNAIIFLEDALNINESHYGPKHTITLRILRDLIRICNSVDNVTKKRELWQKWEQKIDNHSLILHISAGTGDFEMVQSVIDKGADILEKDGHDSVLHQCVMGKSLDVTQLILDNMKEKFFHDVDFYQRVIDVEDSEGDTPLMWAAQSGQNKFIQIFVNYGANLNSRNKEGKTALHWAIKGRHQETVDLLLLNGADSGLLDTESKTLLELSKEK